MRIKTGKLFASFIWQTGHLLLAAHKKWRVRPWVIVRAKPGYRRIYFGPFEAEIHTERRARIDLGAAGKAGAA